MVSSLLCQTLDGLDRHPQIDDVVTMYNEGKADFHQMVADMAKVYLEKKPRQLTLELCMVWVKINWLIF